MSQNRGEADRAGVAAVRCQRRSLRSGGRKTDPALSGGAAISGNSLFCLRGDCLKELPQDLFGVVGRRLAVLEMKSLNVDRLLKAGMSKPA